MQSLRQRQIDEIRNQDLNINKQVVASLNKQVAAFSETVSSPTMDQAINTDKLLNLIDNFNVNMMSEINEMQQSTIIEIMHPGISIEKFNTIMRLRSFIIKNNYNSKNIINQQMQTMIPYINSFIISFNSSIEQFLSSNTQINRNSGYIARFYSILAIGEAARTSLVTGSFRPIDLVDVDTTFNKIVQNLPANIKNDVLFDLAESPMSGFNRGNGEGYEEAKKRLETELGRPLTRNDDLMLAIRLGNFSQFKPILSNTQLSMFDANPHIDISNIPRREAPEHISVVPPLGPAEPNVRGALFPEGFIPQAIPHTALQNEQNEDRDPTTVATSTGHGFAQKFNDTNNTDLHYRDDRNEDPCNSSGKGKSILSRFA